MRNKVLRNKSNYAAKKRGRDRKRIWVNQFKRTASCSRCGFSHPYALQFHHINGKIDKRNAVVNLVNNGVCLNVVKEEIKKCEVLCANCHSIHHRTLEARKQWPSLPKGTFVFNNNSLFL